MKGQKKCPNCSQMVKGVRTHVCPKCNHRFSFGKVQKKEKVISADGNSPSRGQKVCKNCRKIVGARCSSCKYCGFNFSTQISSQSNCVINWHELDRGDYIKVIQGSGPYTVNKLTGEQECIGASGRLRILERKRDGFLCWSKTGYEFVYMGEPKLGVTGVVNLQPHKILKLRPSEKLQNILG